MHLTDVALEAGYDFSTLKLRVGLLGSEPWTNRTREELERRTGMSASDIYGLSELIGPGVSYECFNKDGLHINEDHFLVEVVDPWTGEPVPEGKEGELVFTSLTKEAVPVIRYRSGDLASINYRPCACGRIFARHCKVYARTDDMFVIRGVNIYPSSIEAVLQDIEQVQPHYQIVLCREGSLDQVEIQMEVTPSFFSDAVRKLQGFQRYVEERLRQELGIRPRVRLVEPKTIPPYEGGPRRIIDNRGV